MSHHQRDQYAKNDDLSGTKDHALIYIEDLLCGVPPTPPKRSIFRVRHLMRKANEKAYEPEILVVGPYHYGSDKFKYMEEQKMRYVQRLLKRRNEGSVDRYMPILREMEQRARDCYAETIDLSHEKFLAMMLIDGCFLVELFRKFRMEELRDEDDPLMEADWIRCCLQRDLLLLENQIPFFVLNELYDLTKGPKEPSELINVATWYFDFRPRDLSQNATLRRTLRESKHLLHLMHACWTSGLPSRPSRTQMTEENFAFVSSITELRESGVRLKAVQGQGRHEMDIKFNNGILEIPVFTVQDHTESRLRNLIAYEQHRQGGDVNYFTDYVTFMDCLINSSKDVERLCRKGITKNYLGDNEVVAQMFNKMGDYITLSNFYYFDIFKNVNAHCKRKTNGWMAKLRREHLNSPWALLSISAATMLLLLTAAQTVFTIIK
ncbi:UPF0481 protein At3g47200-like [Rhodamnia argentea]|uniref:UPF0481 protein At3g47200-like n=1 Tax=Rhodamnia argentea TaxID=178133 RepID=A0ABM3HMG2_9MYRT|nr:UPF0481 protein At3g47200-like [Rhodamnia argentea]